MILRRRTVEHLTGDGIPTAVRDLVDGLIVLGGLPCSVVATRRCAPVVMAVGRDRGAALSRLAERLGVP